MARGLARPGGNGGETKLGIKEAGRKESSKRWCTKCDVRYTEILISGRREEYLCTRHTSHKAELCRAQSMAHSCGGWAGVSPGQGSAPPSAPAVWAHPGEQCWLHWAGASLGSWRGATACLDLGQPLLSTVPVHFRGSVSHSWNIFWALFCGHRDLCPSTHLVALLWEIYGSSLTSWVTCLNKWFECGD